jgi:hypothetical protein
MDEQGGPENVQPRVVTLFVLSKCCSKQPERFWSNFPVEVFKTSSGQT